MNIIEKIKQTHKNKTVYINTILNKKNKYLIKFEKKNNKKYISLISNNVKILSGTYKIYGLFKPSLKLWIWGSSIPDCDQETIKYINNIKSFNYLFEKSNDKKSLFYYQLLTQDTLYIKDNTILNWINELLLYFSNDIYYFNPYNEDTNIEFISLSSIKEKFI
jgi:hypothetical protein